MLGVGAPAVLALHFYVGERKLFSDVSEDTRERQPLLVLSF